VGSELSTTPHPHDEADEEDRAASVPKKLAMTLGQHARRDHRLQQDPRITPITSSAMGTISLGRRVDAS
jgi:hypothetical protein